jgi:hypothetical protein
MLLVTKRRFVNDIHVRAHNKERAFIKGSTDSSSKRTDICKVTNQTADFLGDTLGRTVRVKASFVQQDLWVFRNDLRRDDMYIEV